jgi:hypothetical protein
VRATHEAVGDLTGLAPDVPVGALTRIEPLEKVGDDRIVRAVFVTADGREFAIRERWSRLSGLRGGYFRSLRAVGFFRTGLGGDPAMAHLKQRGEAWHEFGHVLFGELHVEDRLALARHAEGLRVLDTPLDEWAELIGRPELAAKGDHDPLRVEYMIRYSGVYKTKAEVDAKIGEEAVMHMVELLHHGHLSPDDIAPVEPILRRLFQGRLPGEEALPDGLPGARRSGSGRSWQEATAEGRLLLRLPCESAFSPETSVKLWVPAADVILINEGKT